MVLKRIFKGKKKEEEKPKNKTRLLFKNIGETLKKGVQNRIKKEVTFAKGAAGALKSGTSKAIKGAKLMATDPVKGIENVGKKIKSTTSNKTSKSKSKSKSNTTSKMSWVEKENRKKFGDKAIDQTKKQHSDWKSMRKGDMSKADFIKKYPNSVTAKEAQGAYKRR